AMASEEGSALGAALLGAVAAGAFRSVPAASATVRVRAAYRPNVRRTREYAALAAWQRRTYEALEPLYRGG
ncbi:MAG: ribulokinase, partial [Planctomycetota bacterium]